MKATNEPENLVFVLRRRSEASHTISTPLRTDAEVYVNRMAIEESLGLSQVLPAEVEERPTPVDRGSSTPLSKQSVKRLLKSLLRTD